jgi:hypothetical protein
MLFMILAEGEPFTPFFVGLSPLTSIALVLALVVLAAGLMISQAALPLEYDPGHGHGEHGDGQEEHASEAHPPAVNPHP